MTPAQRRAWRMEVFGHGDLTLAQKLALLALETYADYPEGTNARPGVVRLANTCGLGKRVVEGALILGQQLGLIAQTSRANPKRGYAACYRLLSTRTGVRIEDVSTRTGVRIEDVSTRIGVRIEDDFQPARNEFQPARNEVSTRTPVRPTNPEHQSNNTKGEGAREQEPPGAEPVPDQRDALHDAGEPANSEPATPDLGQPGDGPQPPSKQSANRTTATADAEPPPRYCSRHPDGTLTNCVACGQARRTREAWEGERADELRDVTAIIKQLIAACDGCDPNGLCDTTHGLTRCGSHFQLADTEDALHALKALSPQALSPS